MYGLLVVDPLAPSSCELGPDFFNATVRCHPSGSFYQTTPSVDMGGSGYKQPGYRSVKRIVLGPGVENVVIFSKQVNDEWRIAETEDESDFIFDEKVPDNAVINSNNLATIPHKFLPWQGKDLTSQAWDASVVVWQWCRGSESQRLENVVASDDIWWCPYLAAENEQIEEAFAANADGVEVHVSGIERSKHIRFKADQAFAVQVGDERNLTMMRVIKTVHDVKNMLEGMTRSTRLNSTKMIPAHFLCPISQVVMDDPVKTVNGHRYERAAIQQWFTVNKTEPLTGLPLRSTNLTPDQILESEIQLWRSNMQRSGYVIV